MTAQIFDLTGQIKAKDAITADDVVALRRVAWPDGIIDAAEAEAIFDLNSTIHGQSRDWVEFFVEAMSVYLVDQQPPVGYVDEPQAAWLMAKIDSDGVVDSLAELELLVRIIERATNVPDSLKNYTLTQIEAAVLTGSGPTRDGGTIDPGSITTSEVALLRRMLFAQGGDGPATISRAEADMLFRIKDATLGAANASEWQTLFVQAVGNHLMAHARYRPLARAEAVRLDAFMDDTGSSVGGFFGRMAKTDFGSALGAVFGTKAAEPDHDAAVAADRAIAPVEFDWLKLKIHADVTLDPLEKALLAFIAEESGAPVAI